MNKPPLFSSDMLVGKPFQGTKGPWFHAEDVGQVGSIEAADGTVVAQAQALVGDVRGAKRRANTKLLAAAPALQESVLNFLGLFDNPLYRRRFGDDPIYKEAIAQGRAAALQSMGMAQPDAQAQKESA